MQRQLSEASKLGAGAIEQTYGTGYPRPSCPKFICPEAVAPWLINTRHSQAIPLASDCLSDTGWKPLALSCCLAPRISGPFWSPHTR